MGGVGGRPPREPLPRGLLSVSGGGISTSGFILEVNSRGADGVPFLKQRSIGESPVRQ